MRAKTYSVWWPLNASLKGCLLKGMKELEFMAIHLTTNIEKVAISKLTLQNEIILVIWYDESN